MDRLSDLPEHILQKILYFLSQQEAAQTSSLSKKWRDLWITRPKVAFSETSFRGTNQEFLSTVNNTLQRYHHQKLSLDEFHLSLSVAKYSDKSLSLLEEWIPRLTQMGVKEFYLSITSSLSFHHEEYDDFPHLPHVVFDAGSCLQELHLSRYKLNLTAHDHQKIIIALKNLKLLHLSKVRIEDEGILQNIISSCHSIETLRLFQCDGLRRVKLDNNLSNLKDFTRYGMFKVGQDKCCSSIEVHESPSLKRIVVERNMIWFQPQEFRNLNYLNLTRVGFSVPDQLSWCKFPCLKSMAMYYCHGFEESHLFFDAPKIVRFIYQGEFIPSISFAPNSSSWNSVVRLSWPQISIDDPLWLLKLSQLLQSLSQSTMSLTIYQGFPMNHRQHFGENIVVVPQPVEVERLELSLICRFSSLTRVLNALFRICRPKNLGNYFNSDKEETELLCKILMQRESQRSDWVRDLEGVRMEIYDENGGKWDEVTASEYLMPKGKKTGECSYRKVRFRLKWRQA